MIFNSTDFDRVAFQIFLKPWADLFRHFMAGNTQGRPEPFGFIISPRRHNRAKALGNLPNNTSRKGARQPFFCHSGRK